MPFKNEKEEVGKTCKSVRDTAGDRVDIVVMNDCSDDGYDYKADLEKYNVRYFESASRMGSSAGKEFCVQKAETPYIMLLDAHSRIYTENWLDLVIELLEKPEAENTIYCCACWYFNDDNDHQSPKHMKAFGGFWDYNIKSIFSCGWNLHNYTINEDNKPFDIPCILGANYFCRKDYWNKLMGYQGLRLYGREETFISLKSLMAGGSVKCYPKICTGHKTRPNNKQPYKCYCYEIAHNEMVIAYLLTPHLFDKLMLAWKSLYQFDMSIYNIAKELFDGHIDELNDLRDKFNKIKVIDQRTVDKFNAQFQKKMGFDFSALVKRNKGTYNKFNHDEKIKITMG
jgi:glycosyltransferase involved in cell wall biosynthesis